MWGRSRARFSGCGDSIRHSCPSRAAWCSAPRCTFRRCIAWRASSSYVGAARAAHCSVTTTLQPDRDSARAETATELRLALFTDTYPPQLNGVSRTLERLVAAIRTRGGEARVYTTTDPEATTASPDIWRRPSIPFWAYPQ